MQTSTRRYGAIKRPVQFIIVLTVALGLVTFLPLYVERTMVRSWRMDQMGDTIEWGWKLCTLRSYWSDYNYFRPEQRPALWLGVNIVLALAYALLIALIIDQVLARLKRREMNP